MSWLDNAPEFIDDNPELVQSLMVNTCSSIPSALTQLESGSRFKPRDMDHVRDYDFSLTRQLYDALHADETTTSLPSAVMLTAKSALPIKFAIEQFAQRGEIELPTLPIVADREISKSFFEDVVRASKMSPSKTGITLPDWLEELKDYTRQSLAPHLGITNGSSEVIVIEQYTQTGRTALFAGVLAMMAGAQKVSIVCGSWYEAISRSEHTIFKYEDLFRCIGDAMFEEYKNLETELAQV